MEKKNDAQAQDLFERMVAQFPEYYVAWFYLGEIHMIQKKYVDAKKSFLKTIELEPDLVEPRFQLIKIYTITTPENYKEKIKSAYKKRCAFVHNGRREEITVEDLLFTDDLLLNLLINLIQHINIFKSKEAVIEFSNKVEAEYLLGVTPRVRPKSLQFSSRHYTADDYLDI